VTVELLNTYILMLYNSRHKDRYITRRVLDTEISNVLQEKIPHSATYNYFCRCTLRATLEYRNFIGMI
jgi:hypothetical protein